MLCPQEGQGHIWALWKAEVRCALVSPAPAQQWAASGHSCDQPLRG